MSPLYVHTTPADENDPDSEESKALLGHEIEGDPKDPDAFSGFALQKDCCCGEPGYYECTPQICGSVIWRGFRPQSGARKPNVKYCVYLSQSIIDQMEELEIQPDGYEWMVGGEIWQISDFLGNDTRANLGIQFPDYVLIQLAFAAIDHTPLPGAYADRMKECRITGSPFQTPSATQFNSLTLSGLFGKVQTWHLGCQILAEGIGALEGNWSLTFCTPNVMSMKFARTHDELKVQMKGANNPYEPVLSEKFINVAHVHTRYVNPAGPNGGTFLDSGLNYDDPLLRTGFYEYPMTSDPYPTYFPILGYSLPRLQYCISEMNIAESTQGFFEHSVVGTISPYFCKGYKSPSDQTGAGWPSDYNCPGFWNAPCGFIVTGQHRSGDLEVVDPPYPGDGQSPEADFLIQQGGQRNSSRLARLSPCGVLSGNWSFSSANSMECCCDDPAGEYGAGNAAFPLTGVLQGGCVKRLPIPPVGRGRTFSSDEWPGGYDIPGETIIPDLGISPFFPISGGTVENS